ncbi:somatostatin receptor type 2-like [Ptychodera flava]|uniref:somatostatin receptor type 2-like n=1 Tax=Ptychodera flava TaxID=63121 RepID=UPI00396A1AEF
MIMNYTTTDVVVTWNDYNLTYNDTVNNNTDGNTEVPYPSKRIMYTVLLVVICVWGIIGNIAFMHVMRKVSYMHTVTNIYLLNLSIADLLFLTLGAVMRIVPIYVQYISLMCLIQSFLIYVSSFASMFTISLISIERYIAICHPLKRRHFDLQRSRCLKHIVVIWVLAVLFTVPSILYCYIPQSELYLTSLVVKTVPFFVSLVIIIVTYTFIIIKLSCRQSIGDRMVEAMVMSKRRKRRLHVVRMLLVTAIVYFVCLLPYHLLQYLLLAVAAGAELSLAEIEPFLRISEIMLYINASANPLIYNIMSKQYRLAFKKAFRCTEVKPEDESFFSANFENRRQSSVYQHAASMPNEELVAHSTDLDNQNETITPGSEKDTDSPECSELSGPSSGHQGFVNMSYVHDECCLSSDISEVNNNQSDNNGQIHVSFSSFDIVHMLDDECGSYIHCSLQANENTCDTYM